MAKNGHKELERDGNGLKRMEMPKNYRNCQMAKIAKIGLKRLKTAEKNPESCKPQISMTPNLNGPKFNDPDSQ